MALPTTSYILLGMLNTGELSGYDLKQLLDKKIHHIYWSPAKSQIYGELRRLEQAGFATMTEIAQTFRPDKRLYRITPAGQEALREWLAESEVEPDIFKSSMLLHVFFGHLMSRETLLKQLETRRRRLAAELTKAEEQEHVLREQLAESAEDEQLSLALLTMRAHNGMLRASIASTTEIVTQLKRNKTAKTAKK